MVVLLVTSSEGSYNEGKTQTQVWLGTLDSQLGPLISRRLTALFAVYIKMFNYMNTCVK